MKCLTGFQPSTDSSIQEPGSTHAYGPHPPIVTLMVSAEEAKPAKIEEIDDLKGAYVKWFVGWQHETDDSIALHYVNRYSTWFIYTIFEILICTVYAFAHIYSV